MGGFISGIAVTIILMQVPKLMGSPAGSGELLELSKHIGHALGQINVLSLAMGVGALILLILAKEIRAEIPDGHPDHDPGRAGHGILPCG